MTEDSGERTPRPEEAFQSTVTDVISFFNLLFIWLPGMLLLFTMSLAALHIWAGMSKVHQPTSDRFVKPLAEWLLEFILKELEPFSSNLPEAPDA